MGTAEPHPETLPLQAALVVGPYGGRMNGYDIIELIGGPGIPTAYRLKQIVQDLKALAGEFGDECLQQLVRKMQVQEAETLRRRFGEREPLPAR